MSTSRKVESKAIYRFPMRATVFAVINHKVVKLTVAGRSHYETMERCDDCETSYRVVYDNDETQQSFSVKEANLFPTREELIASL